MQNYSEDMRNNIFFLLYGQLPAANICIKYLYFGI